MRTFHIRTPDRILNDPFKDVLLLCTRVFLGLMLTYTSVFVARLLSGELPLNIGMVLLSKNIDLISLLIF